MLGCPNHKTPCSLERKERQAGKRLRVVSQDPHTPHRTTKNPCQPLPMDTYGYIRQPHSHCAQFLARVEGNRVLDTFRAPASWCTAGRNVLEPQGCPRSQNGSLWPVTSSGHHKVPRCLSCSCGSARSWCRFGDLAPATSLRYPKGSLLLGSQ